MTNDCLTELSKDYKIKKAYIWSDGCTAQYKGKHSFYYLDKHKDDVAVDVEIHFFCLRPRERRIGHRNWANLKKTQL